MVSALLALAGCAGGSQVQGEDDGVRVLPPATVSGGAPTPGVTAGGDPGFGAQPGTPTTPTDSAVPTAGAAAPPPVDTGDPGFGDPALPDDPASMSPATMDPSMPAMPAASGSNDPIIPAVTGDCPSFNDGVISFMGLGGIQVVSGTKPAGPTAPMVFYWHGTGGSAGEFGLMAGAVRDGVVREGGVLVSFQGTTGGDLRSGTFIFGAGDLELVDQLVACAVRDRNVDPRRIYATGCSAGGLFSTAMAAERSNYVAAAAPNSGGFTIPLAFQNAYTPALMTIHGAPGVDVVAVDFSVTSATADAAFSDHGGFVINCNHGGTHCGGGSLAPDIWEFFSAHPYGVDPVPWSSALPAGFHRSCEIY